ncbi:sensor histidine kinase [Psychroserpens sp.]|uniref:sensor histidine kinase n=1 Tax=Psychroserpens sp. TaxID=2020870 RepID=UPI002B2772CF|nr:histidine kinase [Psychroserpens sp.]
MNNAFEVHFRLLKRNTFPLVKIYTFFFLLVSNLFYGQNDCNCATHLVDNSQIIHNKTDSISQFQVIDKLKNTKFEICQFEGLNLEFHYYNNQLQIDKAFSVLIEQESLLNKIDCKKDFEFKLIYNKARYYHAINDLEKLSDFAFKALTEAERLNDAEKKIKSIIELVYVFTRLNEDEKNWKYIKQAQQLILDLKEPDRFSYYYNWLAYEYENKYTITNRATLLDSVLLFVNKAKKGAFKYRKFGEMSRSYRVEEAIAYHKGDLKKALVNIDSAIYFGKKIKGHKNLSGLYLSKAWDHLDLGELEAANTWMDTSLYYNIERKSAASMMLHREASEIYENANKLDKAFTSYKRYTKLKDSILNIEKLEKINELEQKYNKAKNEQRIVSLEKKEQLYMFIIIGGLLLVLSLIFFFRQRSLKNKQKILETEQRLNRARINPHFFFNAMASLQRLSQQEKSIQTTLYTARLAKIMRQSLENTYEEVVSIEDEIDFLTQYLEIQKLRFPNKFEYQFHIDEDIETNELRLPGMLTQPFVENAIEHGFCDLNYVGKIDIYFKADDLNVYISIEDNGKGIKELESKKEHKSRAMQIVKDRLYLFNMQHKSHAFYNIENLNNDGFKIVITLPKIY